MARIMRLLALFALSFLLRVAQASPARSKRLQDESIQQVVDPFDGGALNSCVPAPTIANCPNIQHSIPASVAKNVEILNAQIQSVYDNFFGMSHLDNASVCAATLRDIHCLQKFPMCNSDDQTVVLSSGENCKKRVTDSCQINAEFLINEGLCELNGTFSTSQCVSIADYGFERCPAEAVAHEVTRWMLEVMLHEDKKLEYQLSQPNGLGDAQFNACRDNYASFLCNMPGHCEDGRIRIVNTVQSCAEVVNCYNPNLESDLRKTLACNLWPSKFSMPEITTPTTLTPTTLLTLPSTWPTLGGSTPQQFGAATSVKSLSILVTVLTGLIVTLLSVL